MDPKALGLLPKIRSASLQTTSKKTTWQRCQIQDGCVVRDGLLLEHVSGLYYSVTQLLYILFSSTNPCFEDGWTKKRHDSFNSTADHSLATPNPGDFLKDWMLLIFHTPENWRLEPEILATNRKGKNHRFLCVPVQTAGFWVSSILIFEVTWLVVEPTHLKNMLVKLGSSSPSFGMKIENTPPKTNMEPGHDNFQVRNLRTSKGPPFSGEPCLFLGVYLSCHHLVVQSGTVSEIGIQGGFPRTFLVQKNPSRPPIGSMGLA